MKTAANGISVCRCIPASSRIQPSLGSSRRTPHSESFSRPRQPCRRGARTPLTRGIVWRAANHSSAAESGAPPSLSRLTIMIMKLWLWHASQTAPILQSNATAAMRSSGTAHLVVLVGAVGMHRRSRHFSRCAEATTRRSLRRRIDNPSGIPTRAFRRSSGAGRLWKTGAQRSHRKGLQWRYVEHRCEGLGCARGEGSSGEGSLRIPPFSCGA